MSDRRAARGEVAEGEARQAANRQRRRPGRDLGTRAANERAIETARSAKGAKRALLPVESYLPHCALMQPAAEAMREALAEVYIAPPVVPLVANVLARQG